MKKLNLSKETVRKLDEALLAEVMAGARATADCTFSGVGTWACCFNPGKPDV